MALNIVVRIISAAIFAIIVWQVLGSVSGVASSWQSFVPWGLAITLAGAVLGAGVGPYLTVRPIAKALNRISQVPASTLVAGTLGLVVGLVAASLISIPLFSLQGWLGWAIPIMVSFTFGLLGIWLGAQRAWEMQRVLPASMNAGSYSAQSNGKILVDTSAIIDGRMADLSQTGFLQGTLVVPRFILDELRHIADSSDSVKRVRGRRGFEVLGRLRRDGTVAVQVLDVDALNGAEVDGQLVKLARSMKASILTTDFNLNRVAELQGVKVLNVNELAHALKPVVLPGEEITVNVVQEGKEVAQGVGYLDDGTMVVVEGGKRYINSLCDVAVTRVLQTAAGRIIFAQPKGE